MEQPFDLIVIGGGPAGITGATTASALGKRVALVERQPELGGAGANTGTVPSKTLRETALALSGMKTRNLYGVDLSLRREATVSDFLGHERHVKAGLNHLLRKGSKPGMPPYITAMPHLRTPTQFGSYPINATLSSFRANIF